MQTIIIAGKRMLPAVGREQGVCGVVLAVCVPKKLNSFIFFQHTFIGHLWGAGTVRSAGYTAANKTQSVYGACIPVKGRATINKQRRKSDDVLKWDNCSGGKEAGKGNKELLCLGRKIRCILNQMIKEHEDPWANHFGTDCFTREGLSLSERCENPGVQCI